MSNRKVLELLLQLKSARDHGKNDRKVKPHLFLFICTDLFSPNLLVQKESEYEVSLAGKLPLCSVRRSMILFEKSFPRRSLRPYTVNPLPGGHFKLACTGVCGHTAGI